MQFGHLHWLPIGIFLLFTFTFATTYVISSFLTKDVEPVFPYISDTGTYVPTSCLFGQMLNFGSILASIVFYIKYKQLNYIDGVHSLKMAGLNDASLFMGWLAALGMGIVANFQETSVFVVHLIGAAMAFGLLGINQILVLIMNRRARKILNISTQKLLIQLTCVILTTITFFLCFAFAMVALTEFTGKDMTKWTSKDGGFDFHLTSVFSEWVCAISAMVFIITYIPEFRQIRISEPEVTIEFD